VTPDDQAKDAPPPHDLKPAVDVVREQDKLMIVASYLGLLALVPLLTVNDSDFVRWHAKNGLVLTMGGGFALGLLNQVPFIRWFSWFGGLVLFALVFVCIFRGLQGVRLRIPVVSDVAEKL
jgi:uncharacterized membrane protein